MSLLEVVKKDDELTAQTKKSLLEILERTDIPGDMRNLYYQSQKKLRKKELDSKKLLAERKELRRAIEDRDKSIKNLEKRLVYNSETGLPNHNILDREINAIIERVNKSYREERFACFFIRLNESYDMIKKTMKPVVAEWVIFKTADRIKTILPEKSRFYHTRDDEFMVLFRDIQSPEQCVEIAKKIIIKVSGLHHFRGQMLSVGCNIGISLYPEHGTNKSRLIQNADIALKEGKKEKNNLTIYRKEMSDRVIEKMELQNSILKALEEQTLVEINKQFKVHYQPLITVIDASDGKMKLKLTGSESLMRWTHPTKGMIPPSKFIPLAEETGLIVPMGYWMLYTSMEQMRIWRDEGLELPYVSINLSPLQFKDKTLVDSIEKVLEIKKIDPHFLNLEITEGSVMEDPESSIQILKKLHKKGINISIDDFGTGYSSLNYLRQFPIDTIKIDRSFVDGVTTNPDNQGIVRAIISIAHHMGIEILSEGIEDEEQLEFLFNEGCRVFQGYFFSKPLPGEEFAAFMMKSEMFR